MVLKAITKPTVLIENNRTIEDKLTPEDILAEISSTPTFYGSYS
jgi:hypothetical protein